MVLERAKPTVCPFRTTQTAILYLQRRGATALAEALKVNCMPVELELGHKQIGDDGARFAKLLKINCTLKKPDLKQLRSTQVQLHAEEVGLEGQPIWRRGGSCARGDAQG